MNKKLVYDILYVGLIIAVILFMIFATYYMLDNRKECLANPIRYFEEKKDMNCMCINYEDSFPQIYTTGGIKE